MAIKKIEIMKTKGKIKILQTIRQGQVGGGETHVFDLTKELDKSRFDIEVLSFTDGPMVEKLNSIGIKTHIIETERPFDLTIWSKVFDLIKTNDYDIIHAHGTRAASNVFYATNKLKKPLIYTVHGWSFHEGQRPIIRRIRELSEKFLTKKADLTIAVSNSNQREGIVKFGLQRSKVIYNGVDAVKFNPDSMYKDIRTEFGIPESKTLVAFLARMTFQKDPLTMVRAIELVSTVTKDVIFLMVGSGEMFEETKKLAIELGVLDQIVFSEFRNDIPDILKATDIYCLPSLWEGMPIGLLEAMFMNKACIATGVDGSAELIESEINGKLVPKKNHLLLATAILDLHRDIKKRSAFSSNAGIYARENFSLIRMVKEIESVYNEYNVLNNL